MCHVKIYVMPSDRQKGSLPKSEPCCKNATSVSPCEAMPKRHGGHFRTESVPALHTFFSAARLTSESSTPDDRFPEFSL
jgi:hypothetical protein